jgi:hypothetical protein
VLSKILSSAAVTLQSIAQAIWTPEGRGTVIAGLAILLSLVLYARSKRDVHLLWATITASVLPANMPELPGLRVTYNGQVISSMCMTTLVFWNGGRGTIASSDISDTDPLRLNPRDVSIRLLLAEIVTTTSPGCGFSLIPNLGIGDIAVRFQYMNSRDGCSIRLFHTGIRGADVTLTGGVRGTTNLQYAHRSWWPALFFMLGLAGVVWLLQWEVLPPYIPAWAMFAEWLPIATGLIGIIIGNYRNTPPKTLKFNSMPDLRSSRERVPPI